MVEDAVRGAVRAVEKRDVALAQAVIAGDRAIDLKELEIEEECLTILALHQPVAQDLRFVVAVLKANHDLERIGDLAKNIAEQAAALADEPPVDLAAFELYELDRLAQTVLKQALDALVNGDADLARQARRTDDQVDRIHRRMYDKVEQRMRQDPDRIRSLTRVLTTVRQLERLADHAVNIAKDVIYLVEGKIARHNRKRRPTDGDGATSSSDG